jgi:hypothetical protein
MLLEDVRYATGIFHRFACQLRDRFGALQPSDPLDVGGM